MTPGAIRSIAAPAYLLAALAGATVPPAARHPNPLIHLLLSFGIVGVLLVSIVDSSFVPLPIPGITDIMIVVLAAQHANLFLLVGAATFGSFLGGFFSYKVGQSGGMAFLEKHVPPRIFKPVCNWMETHAILAVALPAILPPPMPLSPFVLAAGALKMSRNKFLTTFTTSRFLRHAARSLARRLLRPARPAHVEPFSRKWAEILITLERHPHQRRLSPSGRSTRPPRSVGRPSPQTPSRHPHPPSPEPLPLHCNHYHYHCPLHLPPQQRRPHRIPAAKRRQQHRSFPSSAALARAPSASPAESSPPSCCHTRRC
jgi:membrane protein YqaA with SNARE-associated domain